MQLVDCWQREGERSTRYTWEKNSFTGKKADIASMLYLYLVRADQHWLSIVLTQSRRQSTLSATSQITV